MVAVRVRGWGQSAMYMHAKYAHALHERTSLGKPRRTVERSVAVAAAVAARPRPPAVEPRPSASMAATNERPVRVGEGTGEHMAVGWLKGKGTEFELRRLPRTFRRREELLLIDEDGRAARGGTCPRKISDKCTLRSL